MIKPGPNYIVPLQLAAQKGLYQRMASEKIYWVVYEPPYRNRWLDDSVVTKKEKKQDDGYNLHSIRKNATDKVKKRGAKNYLSRIRQIASRNNIAYKGINKPGDFWTFIASCPTGSITRVWYSGHAGGDGLMLALTHNNRCGAAALKTDMIETKHLKQNRKYADRFDFKATKPSKFYGCYTDLFAKEWNQVFNVPSQGSENKVDFGCIDKPSHIQHILKRLERTPTSAGPPKWKSYR
ncbi:MAG: hypothetical protein GY699_07145 [Desulfobacteraceae bacterium]|nr:hypothetical protein [Desulfobacteraceae bacterium]